MERLDHRPRASSSDRPRVLLVSSELLPAANIIWRDEQPFSSDFDDIYYSDRDHDGGADEFRRVFLLPSKLLERAAENQIGAWLTVGELGFGTGLNFALLSEHLLAHSHCRLHFISVEKYPLAHKDWQRVAQKHPQSAIYQALAEHPLPLLGGWQRRQFAEGRIQLSVFHGDVGEALEDLVKRQHQPVDAWFLDGFTPAKNLDMWQPEIMASLAALSHRGTTVSTFTAAGHVRRALDTSGFTMEKISQLPFKRNSLRGDFRGPGRLTQRPPPSGVNVLGAGIAGCSVARALADMGLSVRVFDPDGIAQGGSKMSASALHCRLLGDGSPGAEFRTRAFHHARAVHASYPGFAATGAVQLALSSQEVNKLERIRSTYGGPDSSNATEPWLQFFTADDTQARFGLEAMAALYFPTAGVVDLPSQCQAMLDHANIEVIAANAPPQSAHPRVIACASNSRDHVGDMPLEIGSVFGQLDWIRPTQAHLPLPIVGNGYVIPAQTVNSDIDDDASDAVRTGAERAWVVGSSYEQRPWTAEQASSHNVQSNRRFIGEDPVVQIAHKRASRCVSSDREPVIGKVAEGLWISTAHGSMGTSSAPLAAAIIASEIMGWVPPLSARAMAGIAPQRFIARQARRGVKRVGAD